MANLDHPLHLAKRAYGLLEAPFPRRLVYVLIAMVAAAVVEAVGVGVLFPFLELLTNPDVIQNNGILRYLYATLGFESQRSFLIFVGIGAVGVIAVGQGLSALATWMLAYFSNDLIHNLSVRLFERELGQTYEEFLQDHSANISRKILSEVGQIVNAFYQSVLTIIQKGLVGVAIFALLLWMEPVISLVFLGIVGGLTSLIYIRIRRSVHDLGDDRKHANEERFRSASETFDQIKQVKLRGAEDFFVDRFERADRVLTRNNARMAVIGALPGYLTRTVAFGGMVSLVVVLFALGVDPSRIVPIAGTFAYAGYRMLPAFQDSLSALMRFRYHETLLRELDEVFRQGQRRAVRSAGGPPDEPLGFEEAITLDEVSYRYPASSDHVVEDVTIEIPKKTSVGLVGMTGAGKTTVVDLLMGVLEPDEGTLRVDDVEVTRENISAWQQQLGYVPQEIVLLDDTIRRNIALGQTDDEIDDQRVAAAARLAHIEDFIEDELPEGYETVVGERGTRLSGGQRQRVGIARALYHEPDVLVLDEATSDVDAVTEAAIGEALEELAGEMTVVVVAHRLSTIRSCDQIYVLDHGRVVGSGTYGELQRSSNEFQEMTAEFEGELEPQAEPRATGDGLR